MTHGKRGLRVINGIIYDEWSDSAASTAETIHETDRDTFTGLYDHNGTPLHRQREPVGFNPNRWNTEMASAPNQKPTRKAPKGKKGK